MFGSRSREKVKVVVCRYGVLIFQSDHFFWLDARLRFTVV